MLQKDIMNKPDVSVLIPNVNYVGTVDQVTGGKIVGWCYADNGDGRKTPGFVRLKFSGATFKVEARLAREDVARAHGAPQCGFAFDFPPWYEDELPQVYLGDSTHPIDIVGYASSRIQCELTDELETTFHGWASDKKTVFPKVTLRIDGTVVAEKVAAQPCQRQDRGQNREGFGAFNIRIPPSANREDAVNVDLQINGVTLLQDRRQLPPVRALVISETDNIEDASRKFRCENLCFLLGKRGVSAHLIGPTEFMAREWPDYDFMIFARFGLDAAALEKVMHYKSWFGTKIIFEVDDLIFLPWRTLDLGSVRSGVDDPNNPLLVDMFRRRLRLMSLADGAITTTHTIAEHMGELGLNTFLLPNMTRAHEVRQRVRSAEDPLRLLCMAGSPTHYKDFDEIQLILTRFLEYNSHVKLTLLGRFSDGLPILSMPNVEHIPRVPYAKMMRIIDGHDVCLVPLELTRFNDAKSCLKFIECGARGVPVIASPVDDYRRTLRHMHDGILCETSFEWERALSALVAEPELAVNIGKAAQEKVVSSFCLDSSDVLIADWLLREV
jgi:glycosyltransferase involved in cell wall biosynthesis